MDDFLQSLAFRECTFALVDATMVDLLPDTLTTEVLVPKRLTSSAHLMPKMIDLGRLSKGDMAALHACLGDASAKSEHPPIALFVTTKISASEFARHWNATQLARPRPDRKLWLRVHDPRVLHQLLRILNPLQRRRLFGKSDAFHYFISGKWITALREPDKASGERTLSSELAGWDWQRVERLGIVNRALHNAGVEDALALTSQGAVAEKLIERALERYDLTEQADLVEFTVRGLQCGPAFDEQPTVARALCPPLDSDENTSLSDRFAVIETLVWEALSTSANSSMEHQT